MQVKVFFQRKWNKASSNNDWHKNKYCITRVDLMSLLRFSNERAFEITCFNV